MRYTSTLPLPEIRNVTLSTDRLTTDTCGAAFTLSAPPFAFVGIALRTGTSVVGVAATGAGTVVGEGDVVGVVSTGTVVGGTSTADLPVPAAEAAPVYRRRFTEPTGSVTTLGVAFNDSADATAAGVIVGVTSSSNAAAPATCGVAMEVPDNDREAVGEVVAAETIAEPGAKISTQEPKFE